ncbi:very short patch repair endonuclease [Delftia sp. HK171]|uniref:very short patch repair endonuclease n=1 Tax=Delftia sp. HK171 TaxID=1920191 RepID=UPI00114E1713|nr:DNA mismatch endonuclease Vsr [Delftia sp. HK171]TQL82878.1 T/G mismatch-specific endonuclease [Delftia sp. HK171]
MVDIVSTEKRSSMMGRIKGRDTQAELLVRSYLHRAGLRFKTNDRSLPGSPDLVFPKYRCVIFVHGCFWHRHPGCRFATTPATRVEFWNSKFAANMARDKKAEASLLALGWRTLIIWECEVRDLETLDNLFWQVVFG